MILYIAITVLFLSIWILRKRRNGPRIPGPPGFPLVGNSFQTKPETFHIQLTKWAKQYGPIFKCNVMGIDMVVLNTPELVRKAFCSSETGMILSDRPPSFLGKYVFKDYKAVVFGRKNDMTFKLRRIYHTALHMYGDGIEQFEGVVQREIDRLIVTLAATKGQDFDPRPILKRSLGNLIMLLVCGEPMTGDDENIVWNYINSTNKCMIPTYEFCMYNVPQLRFLPGFFGDVYREATRHIDTLVSRFVIPYKDSYKPGTQRGLVDTFIKLQAENTAADGTTWFTDAQLEGLVLSTIGGGLLTTSNTLLATFLLLLRYPECLDKAYKEVMDVVGSERLPKLSDKPRMPYTEAMIMECQRVANLMPLSVPHNCSEDIVFEGYAVKKDTRFVPNLWAINQDPETWDEPKTFRPERFLDSDGNLLPPEDKTRLAFLMFGAGRRDCVGGVFARSRMFLYVSGIIQKFELLPPNTERLADFDPNTFTPGVMFEPLAYKLRAVRRDE